MLSSQVGASIYKHLHYRCMTLISSRKHFFTILILVWLLEIVVRWLFCRGDSSHWRAFDNWHASLMMLLDETLQLYVCVSSHSLTRTYHTNVHIIEWNTVNRNKSHQIRTNIIIMNKVISYKACFNEMEQRRSEWRRWK